jgi:MoxR-like ATPase
MSSFLFGLEPKILSWRVLMAKRMWKLFLGNGRSPALTQMPDSPAWRAFMSDEDFAQEREASDRRWSKIQALADKDVRGKERGESFRLEDAYTDVLNAVNAALHLRRPLLITGKPGAGKTSLAYTVAHELKLGIVLSWPINARSTLSDGLYRYDAVARLQDAQLQAQRQRANQMGDYIRLGPVGTAFLPSQLPRVLLIDEIDKCDINLPNDLLDLFEEGRYEIPELVRYNNESESVDVRTADADVFATIKSGRVFCREFPFVVMTSNGERDFPPAFLRRCIRLKMPDPSQNKIALVEQG